MQTHTGVDRRSLLLARLIAQRIDADRSRQGLERARQVCTRWLAQGDRAAVREWAGIMAGPWEQIRSVLLEESPRGPVGVPGGRRLPR
jgi:hypothetical protein